MSNYFLKEFERIKNIPSDINEHLAILQNYANKCNSITEFGVRRATSSIAFLSSKADKIVSYDIILTPEAIELAQKSKMLNRNWLLIQGSTLEIQIEQTDLLFIDTLHTYSQLSSELTIHNSKVDKYIILHDTVTFGVRDQITSSVVDPIEKQGLLIAIEEFLKSNSSWTIVAHCKNNNGLMILEKGLK